MKRLLLVLLSILLLLLGLGLLFLFNTGILSFGRPFIYPYSARLPAASPAVVFTHASLVPMDGETILRDQTLVVRDGTIEAIAPAGELTAPDGALVIDATGKYLLPGLVDMHVHVQEENDLLLFAAHGVTGVRNMWGTTGLSRAFGAPDQLALRQAVQKGELLGPTIYTAGPVMEGDPPTTPIMPVVRSPAEARESVLSQATQGYDFIKVYDNLDPATYQAILQAAVEAGLPVIGHTPKRVGLEDVLAGGQATIEHLSGYIDPDAAQFIIPEAELEEYAALTRQAGAWNTPTLVVYRMHVTDEDLPRLEARPEMAYVSPSMKVMWQYMFRPGAMQNISYTGDYPARIAQLNQRMVEALHVQGAGILLGTDANNPYVVPGASLLDELDALVQAGLTPYEALRAGTADAALVLGRLDEFGTLAPGKRADLLLLEANPLEDLSTLRQPAGVMLRGRWLPQDELSAMLDSLRASYTPSWLERLWPLTLLALAVLIINRIFRPSKVHWTLINRI